MEKSLKIEMRAQDIRKRAQILYEGISSPVADEASTDDPLNIAWWKSHPQPEGSNSNRQIAAMILYCEVGQRSKPSLPPATFPARFDCEGGKSLRPDKAIIKVFLEEKLIADRMLGSQLVFSLTGAGEAYHEAAVSKLISPTKGAHEHR